MPTSDSQSVPTSANLGVAMIQHTIFGSYTPNKEWPYDALEVSIKIESASISQKLLRGIVGT